MVQGQWANREGYYEHVTLTRLDALMPEFQYHALCLCRRKLDSLEEQEVSQSTTKGEYI